MDGITEMEEFNNIHSVLQAAHDGINMCLESSMWNMLRETQGLRPRYGYVWIDLEYCYNNSIRRDGFLLKTKLYNLVKDDDVLFEHVDDLHSVYVSWAFDGLTKHVTIDPYEVALRKHYWRWPQPDYLDELVTTLHERYIENIETRTDSVVTKPNLDDVHRRASF